MDDIREKTNREAEDNTILLRYKPTPDEIASVAGTTVPALIAPGLKVLFCGINPSLYSGVVGYHFARPGNRFWRAIAEAGFTDRRLAPEEEKQFLGTTDSQPLAFRTGNAENCCVEKECRVWYDIFVGNSRKCPI